MTIFSGFANCVFNPCSYMRSCAPSPVLSQELIETYRSVQALIAKNRQKIDFSESYRFPGLNGEIDLNRF